MRKICSQNRNGRKRDDVGIIPRLIERTGHDERVIRPLVVTHINERRPIRVFQNGAEISGFGDLVLLAEHQHQRLMNQAERTPCPVQHVKAGKQQIDEIKRILLFQTLFPLFVDAGLHSHPGCLEKHAEVITDSALRENVQRRRNDDQAIDRMLFRHLRAESARERIPDQNDAVSAAFVFPDRRIEQRLHPFVFIGLFVGDIVEHQKPHFVVGMLLVDVFLELGEVVRGVFDQPVRANQYCFHLYFR